MSEFIVLLDESGHAIGSADKVTSHHRDTPLHLAFSCYLLDDDGRVLLTQRSAAKRTFPGVWTNSFCGHPAPGEALPDAVHRRGQDELGVKLADLRLVLPEFRYRAVMADGTAEHEYCPVFAARLKDGPPQLNPAEVDDQRWVTWPEAMAVAQEPAASPWFRTQAQLLAALGEPAGWPGADAAALPPAARW
jgi:isopentenyl-diphosphate delta-isomerase